MFKSIRWRFILVYFMLVFIGMVISGVFIVKAYEVYNLNVVSQRMDEISMFLLPRLQSIPDLSQNESDVETLLNNYKSIGLREELFVIDSDYKVVATTSENKGTNAVGLLKFSLMLDAKREGQPLEDNLSMESNGRVLRTKDKVFPIMDGATKENLGLLYIRYDLGEVYDSLGQAKTIILQATFLALVVTIILGYFIARSITEPINDVTEKAAKMANGDFDQTVDVKSDDEIGKLGEMFNYLTRELKATLSEISSEKSKMEAIINYMDDGLVAVDREGYIIHLNPKAKCLLDIDNALLHFDELMFPFNPTFSFARLVATEENLVGSSHIQKDDAIFKVTYAPFMNDRGEKSGIVFVIQDITEQERLERMRREFVANVSHELKTPLTTIKSYTETLLEGAVDDEEVKQEFLGVVHEEADRMGRLVKDLLQLSNFDSHRADLEFEIHDFIDVVKKALKKVDVTAKAKKHTIKYISDEQTVLGYFDYDRIEQVVLNILSNAIKYTPEDGEIQVFASKEADDMYIRITDNGLGIPAEDITRIFERFYRVDKARARALGGTGLGLAIAKEIIEAHGGAIEISSVYGSGTSVLLKLPMNSSYLLV